MEGHLRELSGCIWEHQWIRCSTSTCHWRHRKMYGKHVDEKIFQKKTETEAQKHHNIILPHMFSRFFRPIIKNPKAGDWQKATSDGAAVQEISHDLSERPENPQRWVFPGYLWVSGGSVANLKHRTAGKLHQVLVCFFCRFQVSTGVNKRNKLMLV